MWFQLVTIPIAKRRGIVSEYLENCPEIRAWLRLSKWQKLAFLSAGSNIVLEVFRVEGFCDFQRRNSPGLRAGYAVALSKKDVLRA